MKLFSFRMFFILSYTSLSQRWCTAFTVSFPVRSVLNLHQSRLLSSTPNEFSSLKYDSIVSSFKRMGQEFFQRSDALRIAGYFDNDMKCATEGSIIITTSSNNCSQYPRTKNPPLLSGVKTGLIIFVIAIGMKFYRSIFVNKLSVFERQPAWGSVITSKEDDEKSNLEAMTCNSCGSTLFIAKGRKWFQFPKDYECYACGAKGIENFTNTRKEIKENFDDDDFEYQNPLDLLSSSEKRKWMKLAGGNEAKAAQLLLEKTSTKNDQSKSKSGDSDIRNDTITMSTTKNQKEVDATSSKTKKVKGALKSEDSLDLLGMDD